MVNTKNVAENKPGSYVGLGALLIGAIPVAGDITKPIIKGEKKVITEVVEDALKTYTIKNKPPKLFLRLAFPTCAVILQFVVERATVNAEQFGCLDAVAAGCFKRLQNMLFFGFGQ